MKQHSPLSRWSTRSLRGSCCTPPTGRSGRGPDRTGISKETGLLQGMAGVAARASCGRRPGLGAGYGSMAVAGDRVFVQGTRGRSSIVIALNRADGKEVWSKALGAVGRRTTRGPGRAARRRSTAIASTC